MPLPSGLQLGSQPPSPDLLSKRPHLAGRSKRGESALLGREQEIAVQVSQVADALLLVVSLWVAQVFRWYLAELFPTIPRIDPFGAFAWLIVIIVPFGPFFLDLNGFYQFPLQKSGRKSASQIVRALFWLGVLIAGCTVFCKLSVNSRSVLLLFELIGGLALWAKERAIVIYLRNRATSGEYKERVLVAGSPDEMSMFARLLSEDQLTQIEILQVIDIRQQPISHLVRALHEHSVGRVIFLTARTELNRVEEAIGACEIEGVEAWLVADFIRTTIAQPAFHFFGSQPMLVFRSTPAISWSLLLKRCIDLVGSLAGLILFAPFMIVVAILIRATSRGPAIFSQARSGKHGKPFKMLKFRSMYSDAEQRRHELEQFNQMSGPVFKLGRDPRITPIGRWLRKYSIDELPQLFNVLVGQMSLVGPRPLPTYEVENFADPAQRRRLSVKPGITCIWQISGRSLIRNFETWNRLDLEYIDNWSIWLDLRILLLTVPATLSSRGAQ
ncbi:MAG: sugar transferase [Verrucomicrobia bacterium]|nr:sugar transferase [Verrucomicrobiota bacterium]